MITTQNSAPTRGELMSQFTNNERRPFADADLVHGYGENTEAIHNVQEGLLMVSPGEINFKENPIDK